jgi:hypothetical protein
MPHNISIAKLWFGKYCGFDFECGIGAIDGRYLILSIVLHDFGVCFGISRKSLGLSFYRLTGSGVIQIKTIGKMIENQDAA